MNYQPFDMPELPRRSEFQEFLKERCNVLVWFAGHANRFIGNCKEDDTRILLMAEGVETALAEMQRVFVDCGFNLEKAGSPDRQNFRGHPEHPEHHLAPKQPSPELLAIHKLLKDAATGADIPYSAEQDQQEQEQRSN